jgi:hypothetical protein
METRGSFVHEQDVGALMPQYFCCMMDFFCCTAESADFKQSLMDDYRLTNCWVEHLFGWVFL